MDDAPEKQAPALAKMAKERFARLYDSEMPRVYRYVSYLVGSSEEAEELTADTFSRALQIWPQVAALPDCPRAWLFALARNRLTAYLYQEQHRPPAPLEQRFDPGEGALSPEQRDATREAVAGLLARLDGLPEGDRNVLALRFGGGLSQRELGEVLGGGEAAAAEALLEAIRRLHESYKEKDDERSK